MVYLLYMKILSYICSHKLIVASVLLVIILAASSAVAYSVMNKPKVASVNNTSSEVKSEIKKPVEKKVAEAAPDVPVAQTIAPAETPAPTPQPTSKSTQEYGKMYLDLSTPQQQGCFDAIVNKWPSRFTEEVRESNVKAIRIYASPCSSGIVHSPYRSVIESYGQNGEFFDSQAAEAGRLK